MLGIVSALNLGCAGNSTQNAYSMAVSDAGNSTAAVSKPGQMSLTEVLVRDLEVTEAEAQGGAGAIMKYAQDSLSPSEFSQVANVIPGMDGLLEAAPSVGGLGGQALSSVTSKAGSLGSAANVASAFQQLNLSPDMVNQFVPVIMNYVKKYGGDSTASILQSPLSKLM